MDELDEAAGAMTGEVADRLLEPDAEAGASDEPALDSSSFRMFWSWEDGGEAEIGDGAGGAWIAGSVAEARVFLAFFSLTGALGDRLGGRLEADSLLEYADCIAVVNSTLAS